MTIKMWPWVQITEFNFNIYYITTFTDPYLYIRDLYILVDIWDFFEILSCLLLFVGGATLTVYFSVLAKDKVEG